MAGWIQMPLGMEVGFHPGDFVLDGAQLDPPTQKSAGWIKIALGMEVGLGPGHIVLDGDPAAVPKKRQRPPFSVHFYCGQTVRCIKMPLGMEV